MAGRMAQQKEEKKQNLLSSAQELFLKKGVAKTSVDEIVQRANVAKGTFYLYFKDKGDLLQALVDQMCNRILERAYLYTKQHHSPDFTENVLTMMDYVIEYFKKDKLVLRLLERNFSWPMVERQLSSQSDPLWQALAADLQASPLAQYYTSDQMFKLIFIIIEMCGSICYASIIEGRPDSIDNMKPMLYDIVRKSLQVPPNS
jgi:AcrR family transcriptional regulator